VQLAKSHGCRLQVGGNDQYGNITAGCELSRKQGGPQLFGLTAPLLLDSTGQKMGKTATGEKIWLDPALTSPYAFYQYWFNRPDAEVPRLLKQFSLEPLAKLDAIIAEHDLDRGKRIGQRELARSMTSWVHGEASIAAIEAAARVMFGGSLEGVTDAVLRQLAATVKTVDIPRAELDAGIAITDLLARVTGDSKSKARQLVQQGGAYINNGKITELEHKVSLAHLATETMLVVRSGKKDYYLVRVA
jgi:tyrosyl-tRNA synthetase